MDRIEENIQAAIERGEFDDLPGVGQPLPRRDSRPGWWVREYIERMHAEDAKVAVEQRLVERMGEAWPLPDEAAVRRWVAEINQVIARTSLEPLSADEVVTSWRRMARLRRQ